VFLLNFKLNNSGQSLLAVLVATAISLIIITGIIQILHVSDLSKNYSNQIVDFYALKESIAALVQEPTQCHAIFQFDSSQSPLLNSSITSTDVSFDSLLSPKIFKYPPTKVDPSDPKYYYPIPLGVTSSSSLLPAAGKVIGGVYYQLWLKIPYPVNPNPNYDSCFNLPGPSNGTIYSPPLSCQGDLFLVRVHPRKLGSNDANYLNQIGLSFYSEKVSGLILTTKSPTNGKIIACQSGNFIDSKTPLGGIAPLVYSPYSTLTLTPNSIVPNTANIPAVSQGPFAPYLRGLVGASILGLPSQIGTSPNYILSPQLSATSIPYNLQSLQVQTIYTYK
jgi:hypothetical protein